MLLTAARWGIAVGDPRLLGRRRLAADWPAIRARLPLLVVPRLLRLHGLQRRALFGAELHLGDQCQHRAGRHSDADLHRQFPAVRAARDRRPDRRLPAVDRRRRADGEPWRTAAPAAARRQFRRCADAARRRRLQRLHGGAAQQAGRPLAKPDDRADRRRPSSRRCRSSPPNSPTAPASCPTRRAGRSSPTPRSFRRSCRRSSTSAASS